MNKNAWKWILLLSIPIFAAKCTAFRPISTEKPRTTSSSSEDKTLLLRNEIADFAQKYEGSKYKYGGTTPKGFDCSGFTFFVMNEFDIKLPHNSAAQSSEGQKTKITNAQKGDLLFFTNKGRINHVGLVLTNDEDGLFMIHGSSSRGIVIDNVYASSYWKPRLHSARCVIK